MSCFNIIAAIYMLIGVPRGERLGVEPQESLEFFELYVCTKYNLSSAPILIES